MKRRTLTLDCREGLGQALITVINTYIDAAYPRGGSPCAAATREAFEALADRLSQSVSLEIAARQRPMLRAAVSWYIDEHHPADPAPFEKLLSALDRNQTH